MSDAHPLSLLLLETWAFLNMQRSPRVELPGSWRRQRERLCARAGRCDACAYQKEF